MLDETNHSLLNDNAKVSELILYSESFSRFSDYLKDLFKETNIKLQKLDSIERVYDYAVHLPKLFISDVPVDLGFDEDYIHLNDYITCPKIFIFESNNELNLHCDELSKFNIFGLAKDNNLQEKIYDHLCSLELVDSTDTYFQMDSLEIETYATICCSMKCLEEKKITIDRPRVRETSHFDTSSIYLPNFQIRFDITPKEIQLKEEQLVLSVDTTSLIKQLELFEFENKDQITLAYISDCPPRFQVFNKLNVKLNYYKSYDAYEGSEDIIIVEDKRISTILSSGTQIAKLQEKSILILNRVFPEERYVNNTSLVKAITSLFDLNAIKAIIQDHINHRANNNTYSFNNKNNLSRAQITINTKILSINETNISIELPFQLEKTSKVRIKFFGDTFVTVIGSEASNSGFINDCQLDGLSEIEINRIRQLLNKMNYLSSKEVEINKFETMEDILSL